MSGNKFQKLSSVIAKVTNAASKGMKKANVHFAANTDLNKLPRMLNKNFNRLSSVGDTE